MAERVTTVPEDLLDVVPGDQQDEVAATGHRNTGRFAFDDKLVDALVRLANQPRLLVLATVGVVVGAAGAYSLLEKSVSFGEGLWWAVVTGFTVGYGDFFPTSTAGRVVGALLIIAMFQLALCLGAQITSRLIEDRDEFTHGEQELIKRRLADILARLEESEAARVEDRRMFEETIARLEEMLVESAKATAADGTTSG